MGTVRGDKRKLRNDRDRAEQVMVELLAEDPDAVYAAAVEAFNVTQHIVQPAAWIEPDDRAAMTWSAWYESSGYVVPLGYGLTFVAAMREARAVHPRADKRRNWGTIIDFTPEIAYSDFKRDSADHEPFYQAVEKRLGEP